MFVLPVTVVAIVCVWATHCSPTHSEVEVFAPKVCLNVAKEVIPESSLCLNVTKEVIPESSVCLNATKEVFPKFLTATMKVSQSSFSLDLGDHCQVFCLSTCNF